MKKRGLLDFVHVGCLGCVVVAGSGSGSEATSEGGKGGKQCYHKKRDYGNIATFVLRRVMDRVEHLYPQAQGIKDWYLLPRTGLIVVEGGSLSVD